MTKLYSGKELFDLRCSHGFPLGIALDRIMTDSKLCIDWIGFIEAARSNEWPDFQTYKTIVHGLEDAEIAKPLREQISQACARYIASTNELYQECLSSVVPA